MIRDKSRAQRFIRDTSKAQRLIDPEVVRRALGAEEIHQLPSLLGAPHALHAISNEIVRRLKSKGGRPGLEGAAKRQKIPFTQSDWERLDQVAKTLSSQLGQSVSPGQVASILVHSQLSHYVAAKPKPVLISSVPGLDKYCAEAQASLRQMEVLTVEGVVEWTRRFPDLTRVWVIVPDFLDDKNERVLDEVVYNMKERSVHFTYFVAAEDTRSNGRFSRLKQLISQRVGPLIAESKISHVSLKDEELMWLQTDHVVANPHRIKHAVGFQFLRLSTQPAIAFRMQDAQLWRMIEKLAGWAKDRSPALVKDLNFSGKKTG